MTDVKVYPNAPVTDLAPPGPPSWNTAPAVAPGAAGIAQSGSAGHWQRWDVTSLVRQWVQNAYTNGGLTLVGTGAPVLFASPLGAGNGDPATAPSLDITYGPRPTTASTGGTVSPKISPNISVNDGATFIYGVAGSFDDCGTPPSHICSDGGPTAITAVASIQTYGFGGNYIRISGNPSGGTAGGPVLSCTRPLPAGYWDNKAYKLLVAAYHNYLGVCLVLLGMPVVYTEINWNVNRIDPNTGDQQYQANAEGSYLVDLFTYLYNHGFTQSPSTSPLRVIWFRGNDIIEGTQRDPLGIYDVHGGEKTVDIGKGGTINGCPDNSVHVAGTHTISNDYYWLRNGECHNP